MILISFNAVKIRKKFKSFFREKSSKIGCFEGFCQLKIQKNKKNLKNVLTKDNNPVIIAKLSQKTANGTLLKHGKSSGHEP